MANKHDRRVVSGVIHEARYAIDELGKLEKQLDHVVRKQLMSYTAARDREIRGLLDSFDTAAGSIPINNATNAALLNRTISRIINLADIYQGLQSPLNAAIVAAGMVASKISAREVGRSVGMADPAKMRGGYKQHLYGDRGRVAYSELTAAAIGGGDSLFRGAPAFGLRPEGMREEYERWTQKGREAMKGAPKNMLPALQALSQDSFNTLHGNEMINTAELRTRLMRKITDPAATTAAMRRELENAGLFGAMRDSAGRRVTVSERADRIVTHSVHKTSMQAEQAMVENIYGQDPGFKAEEQYYAWLCVGDGRTAEDSWRRNGQVLTVTQWGTKDFGDGYFGMKPLRPRDRCANFIVRPDWFSKDLQGKYFNSQTDLPPFHEELKADSMKAVGVKGIGPAAPVAPKGKIPSATHMAPPKRKHISYADADDIPTARSWAKENLGVDVGFVDADGVPVSFPDAADEALALTRTNRAVHRVTDIYNEYPELARSQPIRELNFDVGAGRTASRGTSTETTGLIDSAGRVTRQEVVIPINPQFADDAVLKSFDDVVDEAVFRAHVEQVRSRESYFAIRDPIMVAEENVEAMAEALTLLQNGKYRRGMLDDRLESKLFAYSDTMAGRDAIPPLEFWDNVPELRALFTAEEQAAVYNRMKYVDTSQWNQLTVISKGQDIPIGATIEEVLEVQKRKILEAVEAIDAYRQDFPELRIGGIKLTKHNQAYATVAGTPLPGRVHMGDQIIRLNLDIDEVRELNLLGWQQNGVRHFVDPGTTPDLIKHELGHIVGEHMGFHKGKEWTRYVNDLMTIRETRFAYLEEFIPPSYFAPAAKRPPGDFIHDSWISYYSRDPGRQHRREEAFAEMWRLFRDERYVRYNDVTESLRHGITTELGHQRLPKEIEELFEDLLEGALSDSFTTPTGEIQSILEALNKIE